MLLGYTSTPDFQVESQQKSLKAGVPNPSAHREPPWDLLSPPGPFLQPFLDTGPPLGPVVCLLYARSQRPTNCTPICLARYNGPFKCPFPPKIPFLSQSMPKILPLNPLNKISARWRGRDRADQTPTLQVLICFSVLVQRVVPTSIPTRYEGGEHSPKKR